MSIRTPVRACPRCGRRRQHTAKNRGELCVDCRYVEPHWPDLTTQPERNDHA